MKKNVIILVLVVIALLSISINIFQIVYNRIIYHEAQLNAVCNRDLGNENYQLLSPDVAWLSVNDFLVKQQHMTTSYSDVKAPLSLVLQSAQGHYALYFEDMNTGAWIGINEKEEFVPLSLLKVPIMIATLKDVENGNVSLDQHIIISKQDIDNRSGDLWQKGAGYDITIKDLLIELIKDSDNTAALVLTNRVISDSTLSESVSAMGLPQSENFTYITPRDYANLLRGLYFSNYLRRPFSELALTIMLETDFNSQIPAGVPDTVKVAHKVGFYVNEEYYHDCGIVYAPNNPYILCIMSKGGSPDEADRVMSQVSKIIYDRVTANNSVTN